MKKVYSFWIVLQSPKSRDGCINQLKITENHLSGNYQEKRENYDKEEQLMIYLSKGHSPMDKYKNYDEVLMPIGVLFNNVLDYQEKNEVIKEYGLDDKEFKERMRDMCNLGEALELEARQKARQEAIQEESKRKNVEYVRKIMTKLRMPFKEAIQFLDIPENEEREIEDYFKS